jgi:DNA-binding transcriptional LysR family regulator
VATAREQSAESGAPGVGQAGMGRRWLGVEFRHLGALAAVAREGSFRRAAESLGYVQSAISGQIAQLERAVGAQLVERSSGLPGATLTPAGEVLLSHVDEILARFEAARVDLRVLADATGDAVRMCVPDEIGARRLPGVLAAFGARFPTTQVVVDENHRDEASLDRLVRGELDLVITELPLPHGPFDYTLLERDEYVLVVAASSPLAHQPEPPDAAQLSRLPLILPAPTRVQDPVATRLRECLVDQPPWLRPRSAATAQALVGASLGAAILPRLAVDTEDEQTTIIRLPPILPARLIALVRHREREYLPAVHGLVEVAEMCFNRESGAVL